MSFFAPDANLEAIQAAQDMVTPQRGVQMLPPQKKLRIVNGAIVDDQGVPQGGVTEDQAKALLGMGRPAAQAGQGPQQLIANPLPGRAFTPPKQLIQEPTPFTVIDNPDKQGKAGEVYSELPSGGWVAGGPDNRERFQAQSGNMADQLDLLKRLVNSQANAAGAPVSDADKAFALQMFQAANTGAHQAGQTRSTDNLARIKQYEESVRGPQKDTAEMARAQLESQTRKDVALLANKGMVQQPIVAKLVEKADRGASGAELEAFRNTMADQTREYNQANRPGIAGVAPAPIIKLDAQGRPKVEGGDGPAKPPPKNEDALRAAQILSDLEVRLGARADPIDKKTKGFNVDELYSALAQHPILMQDENTRKGLTKMLSQGLGGQTANQVQDAVAKAFIQRAGQLSGVQNQSAFHGSDLDRTYGGVNFHYRPGGGSGGLLGEPRDTYALTAGPENTRIHAADVPRWNPLGATIGGYMDKLPLARDSTRKQYTEELNAMGPLVRLLRGLQAQ